MAYKKEFKWIEELKDNNYKYMIMPKNKRRVFYASKTAKKTVKGDFYANSLWDRYELLKGEEWGPLSKGVFIEL